jgi:hypothetical protein
VLNEPHLTLVSGAYRMLGRPFLYPRTHSTQEVIH